MGKSIYPDDVKQPIADLFINLQLTIKRDYPVTAKTVDYKDSRMLNFT